MTYLLRNMFPPYICQCCWYGALSSSALVSFPKRVHYIVIVRPDLLMFADILFELFSVALTELEAKIQLTIVPWASSSQIFLASNIASEFTSYLPRRKIY